ncbi:MAG: hypothetical protein ACI80F_001558, partial [Natronomonas sp.]|uniref:hypothetical protein n=1 Tax=Natronomonas sp. TaxID=2184060 RepID=UPI0039891ECF
RGKVIRNPRRVTYQQVPKLDHPEVGLVHDGAYWVSDIVTRDGENTALVDAISLADGYAEPRIGSFRRYGRKPKRHLSRGVQWETPTIDSRRPPANRIEVSLDGVSEVTLWVDEAGLDADEEMTIEIESDGPATLHLATAFETIAIDVPEGETTKKVLLEEPPAEPGAEAA